MFAGLSLLQTTSNVVTVKLQVAVFPEPSVDVQVTVVAPTGKHEPDGGTHAIVTPGQLSEAVVVKLTTAQVAVMQAFCVVVAVTFA